MFYGNACKNLEIAQRCICHCDLFSQIVRLKKAMSKQTNIPMFGTFYCCRRHKFAQMHCCATVIIFMQLAVQLNGTHRIDCSVSSATMVRRTRHSVTLYVCCLSCFKLLCNGMGVSSSLICLWKIYIYVFITGGLKTFSGRDMMKIWKWKTFMILCLVTSRRCWEMNSKSKLLQVKHLVHRPFTF